MDVWDYQWSDARKKIKKKLYKITIPKRAVEWRFDAKNTVLSFGVDMLHFFILSRIRVPQERKKAYKVQ